MSDAGGISTWFSGIEQSSASGSTRSCRLAGGMQSTGYRTTLIRASPTAVAKGSPKPSPAREWT